MPKIVPTKFSRFEFETKEEESAAKKFTVLQEMHLMNLRTEKAEARLELRLDPQNPTAMVQEESWHIGFIECINLLLGDSK